ALLPENPTNCPNMDVPFEWYKPRAFSPRARTAVMTTNVLVLWLDESFFEDEPLLRLPLLWEPLMTNTNTPGLPQPVIAFLGPRRSATLRAMLPGTLAGTRPFSEMPTNLQQAATNILLHISVYCSTPSVMDDALIQHADPQHPRWSVKEEFRTNNFGSFFNFAATDDQLANEVLSELAARHTDLASESNHLVLVSEWDTFYARMLSLTYAAEIARRQSTNHFSRSSFIKGFVKGTTNLPTNFHSFVYLRGLDGQTVGGNSEAKPSNHARTVTTSFEELQKWEPDANKAEGPAQFDYLGRLGDQLGALENGLRNQADRVRIVVGIVGSDVYDTLLILQALRPRFPQFQFFTTDLDARFSHPRELQWSRNLLVISAYGLSLNPVLQGEIAPFRDSTQTAQFA